MFEQVLLETQGRTRKPWTVCVSFLLQVLMVGIIVTIPLIFTDALPIAHLATGIAPPGPPPPPPPPPPAGGTAAPNRTRAVRVFNEGHLSAPTQVPKTIAMIVEDPLPPGTGGTFGGVQGGIEGGIPGGVLGSVLTAANTASAAVAPPPPLVTKPVEPERPKVTRITQGGNVQEARLINKVIPTYPALAKQARVQGTVHLTGIIGRDGMIQQLQVVSGHPLLIQAALDAVRQWRYRPTYLNGDPVEVIAPIAVTFILN